jgi:hypothetical protein
MLSRAARDQRIPMKPFFRVLRAKLSSGDLEQDGLMYGLAGDPVVQSPPDALDDEDRTAIRDALLDAIRDEALTVPEINNAIHAATGKRLDILYLVTWLEGWANDGLLLAFTANGNMPRYQVNPEPPTAEDVQQQRAAADLAERLDITRQAITNRQPTDEISVTWLKRAAPLAGADARDANAVLKALVDLGELRPVNGTPFYEVVTGTADSVDPGQEGDPAVEQSDEPRGHSGQVPAAGASPAPAQPSSADLERSTALQHRTQFERALFDLDDAFKLVRVVRSITTWHTLDEQQLAKTRDLIAMARAWMFDLDGFLDDFDAALDHILSTGEPYLERIEAKPVEDAGQAAEVSA